MMRKDKMNLGRSVQRVAVATVASLVSLSAFGQATVDPTTQPFRTLAPYVLKNSNLEPRVDNPSGGTRAYRPWFENGAWTGDLIEYEILSTGQRLPRDDIGRYPRDGADWRGTSSLWTARYSFPDFLPYDPNDSTWECVEENALYYQERNIFTIRNTNIKTPFLWDQLTPAQRLVLDQSTAADETQDALSYASSILRYVRGDRSLERCKDDGQFRWRFSLLGSIVNSRPVYVPAGAGDGVVIVGANDGMLHGFSATDGSELFAYIPSLILDRVGLQREPATRPRYLMDGELRHRDIGAVGAEQHIVTGGLGAGGKGLFVLDVTDPVDPALITEIAGTNADFVGGATDNRIGYIHGRPTIARLPNGDGSRWYVVSGNGYASTNGRAWLVLIPLDGAPTPVFIETDSTTNNGLSAPSLVDATGNGIVDYAYAGDLQGNLWRFDFSDNSATRIFSAGPTQPIVVEPDIARHPVTDDGFMVFFGTGSLLSAADVDVTSAQSAYGIWDRPLNTAHNSRLPIDASSADNGLVQQTLKTADVTWEIAAGSCGETLGTQATTTTRFIDDQLPLSWSGASHSLGWRVDLPRAGERIIGHPQVRADRIQFITTNPLDMANPPDRADFLTDAAYQAELNRSGSWMLQLDLATGGNALRARALFDLNKDCTLSVADGAPDGATAFDGTAIPVGQYPVGVNLGPYNIAQPAFARVRFDPSVGSVVDGVYINALYLPPQDPPNNVIHGPLDVTTDSPGGPTHAPTPEPVKSPFALRLFPEASGPTKSYLRADGLGHGVDGHSMGYNKHHGVDYVDFFHLEPRRGQTRLDVGAMYNDGGTYRPIVLDPSTSTGLRTSEQELNRVEEVGVGDDQRFIIVLANADLSRGNEIRIGDRTWPVYEYQTMMMQHLRKTEVQMMADLAADNLVFTLRGGFNPICPSSLGPDPEDCENRLRITPIERIGSLDATMGTLPGCVNNTDRYEADLINNAPYTTRKRRHTGGSRNDIGNWELILDNSGNLNAGYTLEDLYADGDDTVRDNPHATPYPPPTGNNILRELGYRWRNGALTVQLLAVNADNSRAFEIQDSDDLPRPNDGVAAIEGIDIGWGGAYAKAFNDDDGPVVPINDPPDRFVGNSGLLYELSMFWHWGDMARFQSSGTGSPVVPVCYGTRTYNPSLAREVEWFTPGSYQQLTADFVGTAEREALQDEYATLVAQIAAGTGDLEAAVLRLQEIISSSPNIAEYHRLRHYVPNSKQLNENHLIRIDRGDWSIDVSEDGTPVEVIDVERDLLPSLGPNYQPGRRSWIDLMPE